MFTSLKIHNFRCFQSFEFQQLARINLLVGANNSGKTSVLEAIQLLCSRTNLNRFHELMIFRGEYLWNESENSRGLQRELDIRHLFYGHEIEAEREFFIQGLNDNTQEKLVASILEISEEKQMSLFDDNITQLGRLDLHLNWVGKKKEVVKLPVSPIGGISTEYIRRRRTNEKLAVETQFVTPLSLDTGELTLLFDEIVLTPEEDLVIEALQIIEPTIKRIASVGPEKYGIQSSNGSSRQRSRSGFVVKTSEYNRPIPIGNMGDGIWRILGIALAIISAKGGVLLVDEIDSGLHYTTMSDMWKLIWETATKFDVQVFATTHNSDCWTSLAKIIKREKIEGNGITLHRIEQKKNKSVVFTEKEIVIAAKRELEVR